MSKWVLLLSNCKDQYIASLLVFTITFAIHYNFFIVLPIHLKTFRSTFKPLILVDPFELVWCLFLCLKILKFFFTVCNLYERKFFKQTRAHNKTCRRSGFCTFANYYHIKIPKVKWSLEKSWYFQKISLLEIRFFHLLMKILYLKGMSSLV